MSKILWNDPLSVHFWQMCIIHHQLIMFFFLCWLNKGPGLVRPLLGWPLHINKKGVKTLPEVSAPQAFLLSVTKKSGSLESYVCTVPVRDKLTVPRSLILKNPRFSILENFEDQGSSRVSRSPRALEKLLMACEKFPRPNLRLLSLENRGLFMWLFLHSWKHA